MPAAPRLIAAEDLYRLQVLSDVRLSPDGKHVVYALQRVDRKTEKKVANLWIVAADGSGAPRQFTWGDQRDRTPRWSPDGSRIAFLSDRGNTDKPAQIHIIPFGGGEARPLGRIDGEIGALEWSPDGRRLLCAVRKQDAEELEREADEQKKKLGVVYRRYERAFFKFDGHGYLPHERWHLWLVDARSGRARQLTDGPVWDEEHPAWSPDGRSIAYMSNRSPDPDLQPDHIDLLVMPSAGGEARSIKTPVGYKIMPSFSPDGQWIAYYGYEGDGLYYKNTGLWVVPADGSAKPRNLTDKYDLHISPMVINDIGAPEQMPPVWSRDGRTLYFQVAHHGSSMLVSLSRDGKTLTEVVGEGGTVGAFSFDREQTRVAYFYGRMDDPGQVYVREMPAGSTRHLTRVNRNVLDGLDLGKVEEHWIETPAGNEVQGWILTPPGFDGRRKYPSILYIHGGPLTQYGKFFMHEFYVLAAAGYVVHFCNPRGGRGYGEAHARAIWGAWGTADYDDLMAWTDFVARKNYIDTKRMGVTGGSYGGYMTLWIIGHSERFKAAVTARCVSNFISEWGSSDLNWTFEYELEAGPPFKDFQKYWDMSPLKYLGAAKTPTMVIHSENDLRCPIEQGEQAFVALKRAGVPSEMIRFPDEFHGLSRTGRTDRRIARIGHILRWFDAYMK